MTRDYVRKTDDEKFMSKDMEDTVKLVTEKKYSSNLLLFSTYSNSFLSLQI